MTEIWKPVVGYEGNYSVSSLGRVRSEPRRVPSAKSSRGTLVPEKIMAGFKCRGYHRVLLSLKGVKRKHSVHVLVLEAFVGPRIGGAEGCHNNGIRDDNRLVNLRWDSHSGNLADRFEHGTARVGEASHRSKLTIEQVRAIRSASGKLRDIAADYDITFAHVRRIKIGAAWGHVT